jgi:hypothetical protein
METIKVYSPVEDKKIQNDLSNSPIWKISYHKDEVDAAMKKHNQMFEYSIKFDGLKPVQVTNIRKV